MPPALLPRAVLLLVFLFTTSGSALSSETSSPGSYDGSGQSYWGPIPARADSVEATIVASPRPLWEYPILVPYRIVEFPVRALGTGMGAAYRGLDDSGALYQISRLLAPKDVPYGFVFTVGGGSLIGASTGITLYHDEFFGKHNRLRLRSKFTTTDAQKITLGAIFREGSATEVEVGIGYRLRRNARFFGLGSEAPEYHKSFYTQETSWGGVQVTRRLAPETYFGLGAIYSGIGARGADEEHTPYIDDEFATVPKGFGDLSEGLTVSLSLIHDTTDDTGRPESGNIERLRATYFGSGGDEAKVDFWSYRADLETFIPLWLTERALAVRAYLQWQDSEASDTPFQRLLTNDEPDLFRGYRDYRWRDRGITALSVEYRWPLWAYKDLDSLGLDAYLFTDIGQVFHEFDRIAANNLTQSYGGGIRVMGNRGFGSRLEVAFSEEETVFRLSSDQIFQYAKGGLLNGRDQAALR